ncbi:MAG: cation:proton antiporter [Candidatus Omnitrophica bacterium]|nr:cation:proton antiporter [Candidatus Omnitrophota bacterium]
MNIILGVGIILVFGLLSGKLAEKVKTPAITAYLLLGIVFGPFMLGFISEDMLKVSGTISNIALSLIAFSIGQNFSGKIFRQVGKQVMWISILEAVGAWLITLIGLLFFKVPAYMALIFGAIAAASAPAAIIMVVREYKARGQFVDILMGVVALDDAWGLIIFSLSLAVAKAMYLDLSSSLGSMLMGAVIEIAGSFLVGGVLGIILSRIGLFLKNQTDLLIWTIGVIFVATGIALHFHFSVLLTSMFLAAVVVNLNNESFKFFDILNHIDWPIYLIFFVLAGASLEIDLLSKIGVIGIVYMIFRIVGKFLGTYLGAHIAKSDDDVKKYLSLGLLPQAGVALGMALIAKEQFPQAGNIIFTTVAATTVIYEIIGPFFVKLALHKTNQIHN